MTTQTTAPSVTISDFQWAKALVKCCNQFFEGRITPEEWHRQMRWLWDNIDRAGMTAAVTKLIDPLNPERVR